VSQVYVKADSVLKNTRALMMGSIYIIVLNILFTFIPMKYLGIGGIPLGTSCASLFAAIYFGYTFEIKWNNERVSG